jgi:hypothetical protein
MALCELAQIESTLLKAEKTFEAEGTPSEKQNGMASSDP